MKKIIILFSFFILLTSCNTDKVQNKEAEIESLQQKIVSLKKENKQLKDSLISNEKERLLNSHILGYENDYDSLKNEYKLVFFLHEHRKATPYDLYKIVKEGNTTRRELLVRNQGTPYATVNYTPKNEADKDMILKAVFMVGKDSLTSETTFHF